LLHLPQLLAVTGLGKTKIYELQAEGSFPMRVKITAHSVAWVENEVQGWVAARIASRTSWSAREESACFPGEKLKAAS